MSKRWHLDFFFYKGYMEMAVVDGMVIVQNNL